MYCAVHYRQRFSEACVNLCWSKRKRKTHRGCWWLQIILSQNCTDWGMFCVVSIGYLLCHTVSLNCWTRWGSYHHCLCHSVSHSLADLLACQCLVPSEQPRSWPNRRTCLHPNFMFRCHFAAGQTVHENRLLKACFPVFNTDSLELAATNSSHQWFSDCF